MQSPSINHARISINVPQAMRAELQAVAAELAVPEATLVKLSLRKFLRSNGARPVPPDRPERANRGTLD